MFEEEAKHGTLLCIIAEHVYQPAKHVAEQALGFVFYLHRRQSSAFLRHDGQQVGWQRFVQGLHHMRRLNGNHGGQPAYVVLVGNSYNLRHHGTLGQQVERTQKHLVHGLHRQVVVT